MRRLILSAFLATIVVGTASAQPLVDPFALTLPSWDSTPSRWLPAVGGATIDELGILTTDSTGHFRWSDGSRARFVGVSVISTACFPDSATAVATAARLSKLGVNMVRFNYFDYSNYNAASPLLPGTRGDTLSPTQMDRLDFFLHQLGRRGIHVHFVLKSRQAPRREDRVDGWDSTYGSGQYLTFINPQFQGLQRRYLSALLSHRNRYTGRRYADDPTIALYTVSDQNSIWDSWGNDRLNHRTGYLSYRHSRVADSLYNEFLRRRYGSTAAIRTAWFEGIRSVGPNLIPNGGFDDFTDNWNLTVGEGAQASAVVVQGSDVPPGGEPNALRVVVRRVNGVESRILLEQSNIPVKPGHVYRIRFRARTDTAAGRQIRLQLFRSISPFDNFGVNATFDLTTSWQTFDLTFRALGGDTLATRLRFSLGRSMGDLFLDGVELKETGREGLDPQETLESASIGRTRFAELSSMSLRRYLDQIDFYDSLQRSYHAAMREHLRSLGVRAPIAALNSTYHALDSWSQSEYDFTSETASWDYISARAAGIPFSDSTWVMRNYSVLSYRDQKIPEFSRNAVAGRPFIAEQYAHLGPNRHRPEMMLFLPAYAALQSWDGYYFYHYNDRLTESVDRRQIPTGDYYGMMADAATMALLPQASALLREGMLAPARRPLMIRHDTADLRMIPLLGRGLLGVDGNLPNVAAMITEVRVDSFMASRHRTAGDYYLTIPNDDDIASDNDQIHLDATKGILRVDAPLFQGASGALAEVSAVRGSNLTVGWLAGSLHPTVLWSSLDSLPLDSSRRSLLTIATRALNRGAVWQFGDSSLGKLWGEGPLEMEGVRLAFTFMTAADTLLLHPLDSLGRETERVIVAERSTSGGFRTTIDLAETGSVWYGVEQIFTPKQSGAPRREELAGAGVAVVEGPYPSPSRDEAVFHVTVSSGTEMLQWEVVDQLGRRVEGGESRARAGSSSLRLETRGLSEGCYLVRFFVGGRGMTRPLIIAR